MHRKFWKIGVRLMCMFFFGFGVSNLEAVVDLGELQRQGQGAPIYPIAIESNAPKALQLANAAFRLHGSYRLVASAEAVFIFRLNQKDTSRVELVIESGHPAQVQFRQEVMGESLESALLKACDLAVTKTIGLPGFFAGKITFVKTIKTNQRQLQNTGTGKMALTKTEKIDQNQSQEKSTVNFQSGKVTYSMNGKSMKSTPPRISEICTSDLFFHKILQLTDDKKHSVTPHWSNDGMRIVYTGYLDGFPDLFVIDLQNGRRRPFAAYQGVNTGGVFHPTGNQVAMVLSSPGNPEIYVANGQGKNPIRLTHSPQSIEASPTWSPDGKKLAYTSDRMGGPQIFMLDWGGKKGRSERRLTFNMSGYCAEPHWNPVMANSIAFTAAISKTFQIALLDLTTQKACPLTNAPGDAVEPCWLNDGRHLIFTRRQNGDERLCLIDTLTGKETLLHGSELGSLSQASFFYPKATNTEGSKTARLKGSKVATTKATNTEGSKVATTEQ